MYKINFKKPIHVHFIGIGGISMSGLAEILLTSHFTISGSDMNKSTITDHLESKGVSFYHGHSAKNLANSVDLVVYTAAIKDDNEELAYARKSLIPTIDRAALLGQIMANYPHSIGVAGTHGKTTTTSMISHILLSAKKDPTISVGGILHAISGNIRVGHSGYFVTEACEYSNSYHQFLPEIAIILNIEEDHMDFFKDLTMIRASFKKYMENVSDNGFIIINTEIPDYKSLICDQTSTVITYGSKESGAKYYADNITFDENGCGSYDLYIDGSLQDTISLGTTGRHNVSNSLAAIASTHVLGIDMPSIKEGLETFKGTKRRYEYKGTINGINIVDDYAHHPTEIKTTIETAKKTNLRDLWVVFQPHTYTRTHAFLDDFANALSLADHIIITDIYAAREKDTGLVHAKDLYEKLKEKHPRCYYIPDFSSIEKTILEKCQVNDLLITMGAGNINIIGEHLLKS